MSNIRRDHQKSFKINQRLNNKDDNQRYHRKRTNSNRSNDQFNLQETSNIDAKVYVGNVPTDHLTDGQLLEFFKPFGKISDIRVYKGYIFVQYDRIDDARKLIEQGQNSLILKGNKLDVLPAMDASSINTKSSSKDYKSSERESSVRRSNDNRHLSNYEPSKKRLTHKHHSDHHQRHQTFTNNQNNYGDSNEMEIVDDLFNSKRSCSRRLSRSPNNSLSRNNESSYTILTGPDNPRQLVDCRIIIVNPRQRGYGEEISSHLRCHGLITSIILLREDYTLTEAIENAANDQCLYGIIVMPMHEERHTASFHILHGQTEEHRNLTLEDGYHIILTNFINYKERILNEQKNETIIYPSSKEFVRQEQPITLNDKFPLSMLLCLLADGRQLTLDEIDRILVYLLEKKAKMLTLPQGTLPPLPVQYANINTVQPKPVTTTNDSSSELSSTIAEQIRQIFSSNLIKSSSLISKDEKLSDENNHKIDYQDKNQSSFSYSNSISVVTPSFNYPSSTNQNSFVSSFNSPLKQSTTSNLSSQYLYPSTTTIQNQNLYQTLPNTAAADAAAAIFQAYSQFNTRTTPIINQQTNTQHQQIQK